MNSRYNQRLQVQIQRMEATLNDPRTDERRKQIIRRQIDTLKQRLQGTQSADRN
jgi:hypothetical protein